MVVYIEDILVTGDSNESQLANLLVRLEDAGLPRKKSVFMASSVTYLGHKIDGEGLHPSEEKVKAVNDAINPRNMQELKSYLGLLNYYGKFLPNIDRVSTIVQVIARRTKVEIARERNSSFSKFKISVNLFTTTNSF